MEKICTECGEKKRLDDFYVHSTGLLFAKCKECAKKRSKVWRKNNPEKRRIAAARWRKNNRDKILKKQRKWHESHRDRNSAYAKKSNAKNRELVLNHYSVNGISKCKCCGEQEKKFLSVDHINGGGGKHRKRLGLTGGMFYRWLIKNNFPAGFQVLCHNCNLAKGFYGQCPHEGKRD